MMLRTDDAQPIAAAERRARSPVLVILALISAQFAAADGITGIYVMLPAIYREFSSQAAAISWIITTFFLVAATMAAVAGRLADLIGRRTVAIGVLLIACTGGLLGSIEQSVAGLIAASVLMGMCTILAPILIGLAREHLDASRIGIAVGAIAAAGSAGAGLIFLITGVLVDHFGRTGGYLFASLLTATAAIMLTIGVPRPPRVAFRLSEVDFVRGVLFGPAVAGMILSIEMGAQRGWDNGAALSLFGASLAIALYWWRNQLRQDRPLINLRLLSAGQAPRAMFGMMLLGVAIQQGQILSLIMQQTAADGVGFGLSATLAGLVMVPINGTAAIVSPTAGWLTKRHGARPVAIAGAVVLALGWVSCAFTFEALGPLVASAILSLVGLSLLMPGLYLLIVESTPPNLTSGAAGLAYTLFNLGFAVGSQVVLGILMGHDARLPPVGDDYRLAFYTMAGAAAAIVAVLVVSRTTTFGAKGIVR